MRLDLILQLGQQTLLIALMISAPPILVAMLIGLIVSVFQAATQIQEQTLSFVPKLIGVSLTIALFGLWAINLLARFAGSVFESIPRWVHP